MLFHRRCLGKAPLIRRPLSRDPSWRPCWGKGVPGGGHSKSEGPEETSTVRGFEAQKEPGRRKDSAKGKPVQDEVPLRALASARRATGAQRGLRTEK